MVRSLEWMGEKVKEVSLYLNYLKIIYKIQKMKIKKYIVFYFLLSTTLGFGQNAFAPTHIISTDETYTEIPDENWQMLHDTSEKWTIEDVQSLSIASKFYRNNTQQTGVGFSGIRTYWQRLKLKNSSAKELKLIFSNKPNADRYDLYIIRPNSKIVHLVSGSSVPLSKRDGIKTKQVIDLSFDPFEEVTLYKRLYFHKSNKISHLSFFYYDYDHYITKNFLEVSKWRTDDGRDWLIAGLLFFGFFLNFFFFWINRDKMYLVLALVLLIEGVWYLELKGLIFFEENPELGFYFKFIILDLVFWGLITQFVRLFLKTKIYYPTWDKTLLILYVFFVISHTLDLFIFPQIVSKSEYTIYQWIFQIFFTLMTTSHLISFLFFKKENDKLTYFSVLAAVPVFFIWGILYNLNGMYGVLANLFNWETPYFFSWLISNMNVMELIGISWFAIGFTWILLQRYALIRKQLTIQELSRERERSEIMQQQKVILEVQVEERTSELKKSLEELKSTQTQLIQSEKMASLGELTAGIAHEIQNPLNFVNNFSEVSTELVREMNEEIDMGNLIDAKEIAKDLKLNLEKINHHGKRAGDIVRGMLQHSSIGSGRKEPTNINALADEYLRLAYHGLRAKDKSFNATMKTDFDETIGEINIVPQDMGRVILNLITNAFYVVNEKNKQNISGYEPMVTVSTKKENNKIFISVQDNGNGIPEKIVDKIFQPFFTTKPTGQGTGLGLSLSYDIVKGHGGTLDVESTEGEGTTFIVTLPCT
jgi:two-component system, NtrC family, sensor kinase